MAEDGKGKQPGRWLVHLALIATQIMFGAGAVIGALGLPSTNPLLFALIRECVAGPILLAASVLLTPVGPAEGLREWVSFAKLGLCIYANQLCFLVGLKLSNPVTGSIWQPSQPIMTAAIAISLGWETPNWRRLAGIFLAFAGCASMVMVGAETSTQTPGRALAGNIFFFCNCLGTSLYVIRSKPLVRRYPSLCVTAWSYLAASVYMLLTAVCFNNWPAALDFLCPDCEGRGWHVPNETLPALAYWIVFQSVLAYALMTWANKFASASLVSAYSVLQPVTSAALTAAVLLLDLYHSCDDEDHKEGHCLEMPGTGDLGAIGVFLGLYLIITTEPPAAKGDSSDDDDAATQDLQTPLHAAAQQSGSPRGGGAANVSLNASGNDSLLA